MKGTTWGSNDPPCNHLTQSLALKSGHYNSVQAVGDGVRVGGKTLDPVLFSCPYIIQVCEDSPISKHWLKSS